MKKKKRTPLELGRVPALEELRAFFRENDFSAAAYMDMDYDKLDAGIVETLEHIKGLMDEHWEPRSREMGLKADSSNYGKDMPGLRTTTLSYKNKKAVYHDEAEQVLIKDTHEALITQEQWDLVQELRQRKKRTPQQMDEPNLFSGLVFCADCGKPLVLHRAHTMDAIKNNFMRYTYKKRGKEVCSSHYIREHDLMRIILDDLRRVTHFARQKEVLFAAYINRKNSVELRKEMNSLQKELDAARRRDTELTVLFKRLYEDNVLGRVTNEQFRILSTDYNDEQKALREVIPPRKPGCKSWQTLPPMWTRSLKRPSGTRRFVS